jgi:hypothetical protein
MTLSITGEGDSLQHGDVTIVNHAAEPFTIESLPTGILVDGNAQPVSMESRLRLQAMAITLEPGETSSPLQVNFTDEKCDDNVASGTQGVAVVRGRFGDGDAQVLTSPPSGR